MKELEDAVTRLKEEKVSTDKYDMDLYQLNLRIEQLSAPKTEQSVRSPSTLEHREPLTPEPAFDNKILDLLN